VDRGHIGSFIWSLALSHILDGDDVEREAKRSCGPYKSSGCVDSDGEPFFKNTSIKWFSVATSLVTISTTHCIIMALRCLYHRFI
jgi:hypothetical protein